MHWYDLRSRCAVLSAVDRTSCQLQQLAVRCMHTAVPALISLTLAQRQRLYGRSPCICCMPTTGDQVRLVVAMHNSKRSDPICEPGNILLFLNDNTIDQARLSQRRGVCVAVVPKVTFGRKA